jgi:collagenase-like PrtC family protease
MGYSASGGNGKGMELLAPAGARGHGGTAFDCGADAVYCDEELQRPRRTENFPWRDGQAHRLRAEDGRKVYVTFNT